ncbi:MAG: hypothetical protein ABR610_03225 [Thermoanaerobaculia bacterium]
MTIDPDYSENDPAWSPDGREIAFGRTTSNASGIQAAIWIMSADGTSPRRVLDGVTGRIAWLPDGKHMMIQKDDGLLRLDLASKVAAPVAGASGRTLFSVDRSGDWIAFQIADRGKMRIAAIPSGGGTSRIVDTGSYDAYHPSFSPSGRWLYFQPDHKNLFRVPGPAQAWSTGPPEKVTELSGPDLYIEDPKISPDGAKLFYTRGRRTGDIFILRADSNARRKSR